MRACDDCQSYVVLNNCDVVSASVSVKAMPFDYLSYYFTRCGAVLEQSLAQGFQRLESVVRFVTKRQCEFFVCEEHIFKSGSIRFPQ